MADTLEQITPIQLPAVRPAEGTRAAAVPYAFIFTGAENLRIRVWSSLANQTVIVRGRLILADGTVSWLQWAVSPASIFFAQTLDVPMGAGVLTNLVAVATDLTTRIGQTFVQVQTIIGLGGSTLALGTLVQDYVTSQQAVAYPGSPLRNSLDGPGFPINYPFADFGFGIEAFFSVPLGRRWQLVSFSGLLNLSAAAGNRSPHLEALDNTGARLWLIPPAAVCAPNSSYGIQWIDGVQAVLPSTFGFQCMPLPNQSVYFRPESLQTLTQGFDAADKWTQVNLYVREWLEAN